jgi:pyruvate kinase
VKQKLDFIAVPGIVSAKDLQEIRRQIHDDSKVAILAKIDSLEGVHNFEVILKYADGVVIVRNELAFEFQPEKLMVAQKWMTQTANHFAKPVFMQS